MPATKKIKKISALEILDSRGIPTLSVKIELENGVKGSAQVPSGTSSGKSEAQELRDGGSRYGGKGVLQAKQNVEEVILPKLKGKLVNDLQKLEKIMIDLDGTPNKSKLGSNAILGVGLALARVGAHSLKMRLYEYLRKVYKLKYKDFILPRPMFNLLNGGAHADSGMDVQEFMFIPKAKNFREAMEMASRVYFGLKNILQMRQLSTAVGLEGGFAPKLDHSKEAIELMMEAASKADIRPTEYEIGLDVAASELFQNKHDERYVFKREGAVFSREQIIGWYQELVSKYPVTFIEDGLDQEDWEGWSKLTARLGQGTNIVGDDFIVTNVARLKKAIQKKSINALIIKPNQIGTLTETMAAIVLAQQYKLKVIISHRSGDTSDPFIADLAVAVNAEFIKSGSVSRGERLAKYNRLLEIEDQLG